MRADIFARAVPWTRLILRERKLPADMNLTWRSRMSALAAWGLLGALLADLILLLMAPTWVWATRLAGTLAMVSVVGLNADLFAFFTRRGGLAFAVKAAGLHTLYLLYSSLVFAVLWAENKWWFKQEGRGGQAIP